MTPPDLAMVAPYPTRGRRHSGPSGVASYTANLCAALSSVGVAVEVIAPVEPDVPDEPADAWDGEVRVRRAFARGPQALVAAARAARESGAPVAHLQHEIFLYGGPTSVPGLVPALASLRRRTSSVVTMHQVVDPGTIDREFTSLHRVRLPAPAARRGLASVQRTVAALSDVCIVHERPFADVVAGASVIPHGVERRPTPDRDEAREQLGLDDRLAVLCFGFLAPYKGLEAVLEAGRLVGHEHAQVVIAGGPHPRLEAGGDRYAGELEAVHGGPGARFTGWVPESDVARWFAAADVAVFAYPAPFSSSGALALAFAHRTPILLSEAMAACVGAPGELVAPLGAAGLAERLSSLLDPAARAALRDASVPLSAGRTWPAVADAHLELYSRLVA